MKNKLNNKVRYIRVAKMPIDSVIPHIFTKEKRHNLRSKGISYNSVDWQIASQHTYPVIIGEKLENITISMGSHRYQLFEAKGTICVCCGTRGLFFAIERGIYDNPSKFHLNLYGLDENMEEIMLTKDHVIPRSKGGENSLSNYQTLCYKCNQRKADRG